MPRLPPRFRAGNPQAGGECDEERTTEIPSAEATRRVDVAKQSTLILGTPQSVASCSATCGAQYGSLSLDTIRPGSSSG